MVSLSAAIMAHPSRGEMVDELLSSLDREIPVSWDGPPDNLPLPERVWRNSRRTWSMADPGSDWHLLLQDDVVVAKDLLAGIELALEWVPDRIGIVQFFIGKYRPLGPVFVNLGTEADRIGATWIEHRSMCWGVAQAVRTPTIPAMLKWCDGRRGMADDSRVGRYYRDVLHQRTWYTWPSLVNHRDGPSLVHHGAGRTAQRFYSGSALDLSWDGPVVDHARHPQYKTTHVGRKEQKRMPRIVRL
jgi:hypothetical protein